MGLYQNIGKPRYWIPITPFLQEQGLIEINQDLNLGIDFEIKNLNSLLDLDPYNQAYISGGNPHKITLNFLDNSWIDEGQKYFVGMIGQQFSTTLGEGWVSFETDGVDNSQFTNSTDFIQYNHTNAVVGMQPEFDGLYLREFNLPKVESLSFIFETNRGSNLSSLFIGKVYDSSSFPRNVNLDLEFTRSYNNRKLTTDAGLQYSNSHYMTSPLAKYYNLYSRNLQFNNPDYPYVSQLNYTHTPNQIHGRSDLRSWSLSYLNVSEQNVFSKSDSINPIDTDSTDVETYNLYKDNSTFDQLTHFTLGDSLPFIFQPDEDNFMPDQFALCRFGSSNFKFERDSFNSYRYSIDVEEEF